MAPPSFPVHHFPRLVWLTVVAVVWPGPAGFSGNETPGSVEAVQRAAAELAAVRAETARLQSDWQWQRDTIGATIEALEQRLHDLGLERDLVEAESAGTRTEIEELSARAAEARAMYDRVDTDLKAVAARLIALQPWLPPRLALAVALPLRTLSNPELSAGERMQYIATVWARCLEFNRSITYAEETLAPDGAGTPRIMDVMYWGMSHAYALDRGAGMAYIGFPGKAGWHWDLAEGILPQVERMIAVYQDRSEPAFVDVPVQVRSPQTGGRK